jgi:hypothetical protein
MSASPPQAECRFAPMAGIVIILPPLGKCRASTGFLSTGQANCIGDERHWNAEFCTHGQGEPASLQPMRND